MKGFLQAMQVAVVVTIAGVGLLSVSTAMAEDTATVELPESFGGKFILKDQDIAWLLNCNAISGGNFSTVSEDDLLSFDNLESNHKVVRYMRPPRSREDRIRDFECPDGTLAVVTNRLWEAWKSERQVSLRLLDFKSDVDRGYRVAGFYGQNSVEPLERDANGFVNFFSKVYDIDTSDASAEAPQEREEFYLGNVGNTGTSSGPHIHLETVVDGENVDPDQYVHLIRVGGIPLSSFRISSEYGKHRSTGIHRGVDYASTNSMQINNLPITTEHEVAWYTEGNQRDDEGYHIGAGRYIKFGLENVPGVTFKIFHLNKSTVSSDLGKQQAVG